MNYLLTLKAYMKMLDYVIEQRNTLFKEIEKLKK